MSVYGVGRTHGRRDVAEAILALVEDTARKYIDGDRNLDTSLLLEDLATRLVEVAERNGADADLFPTVPDIVRARIAFDLLPPEEKS